MVERGKESIKLNISSDIIFSIADKRYGDDMDEMMDSSAESSDDEDNEDGGDDKPKSKKKGKKGAPPKKRRQRASDDEEEDSDGREGRELDYISSSDAER